MASPPAFPSKPSLDDFAVSATELGVGNGCRVVLATHRASGYAFALKIFNKEAIAKASRRAPGLTTAILQEKAVAARVGDGLAAPRLHATFSDARAV
jgi:hypothetical protein